MQWTYDIASQMGNCGATNGETMINIRANFYCIAATTTSRTRVSENTTLVTLGENQIGLPLRAGEADCQNRTLLLANEES